MTKLQQWMTKNGKRDSEIARTVRRSRTQISRIRRGVTAASPVTAHRLEALTGIRWWNFVDVKRKVSR